VSESRLDRDSHNIVWAQAHLVPAPTTAAKATRLVAASAIRYITVFMLISYRNLRPAPVAATSMTSDDTNKLSLNR
jgi:hypothetical protein